MSNPSNAYFRLDKLAVKVVLLVKSRAFSLFDNSRDGPIIAEAELEVPIEVKPRNRRVTGAVEMVHVTLKFTVHGRALKLLLPLVSKGNFSDTVTGFRVCSCSCSCCCS